MDLRKINSYMILLAIVVVVGLFVSTVARLVILAKGVDAGTANLVFLIMLGTCAIAYLTILAAFSSIADFIADKILPKIARKKALTAWKIQCKLPPKTKRFCPLKTFNNAPLKSLDRWGYYYFRFSLV